jgi:hypothetical protein
MDTLLCWVMSCAGRSQATIPSLLQGRHCFTLFTNTYSLIILQIGATHSEFQKELLKKAKVSKVERYFSKRNLFYCRSQWPRGLRRRSAAARLLGLWIRIPPGSRMSVCREYCVLSGRSHCNELITRPELPPVVRR